MSGKMIVRGGIASRFPMKIPVFHIDANGEAHVGGGRQLFSRSALRVGTMKAEQRGVSAGNHFRMQLDFDSAPITGVCQEVPRRGRAGIKVREVPSIKA